MFTIDLLKGQGLPERSKPHRIAVAAVTFAVPLMAAIMMFGIYLSDSVAISVQKGEIINYETKTNELSDAVEQQESLLKEKNAINDSMSEASSAIHRHTQWSAVLATVVENMPDLMVLTNLEVKQRPVKRKVPKKDDPHTQVDISVPQRTLRISISGKPQSNCDKAVRDFGDLLRSSTVLGPKLENIKISQDVGKLGDQEVASYDVDCIFKAGL